MKFIVLGATPEAFVKRAFKLLYDECQVVGMGILQARNSVTEEDVWKHVNYEQGRPSGDYVFGRMMKWHCHYDKDSVQIPDRGGYRVDYQSFCGVYPTPVAIVEAVCQSLGCKVKLAEDANDPHSQARPTLSPASSSVLHPTQQEGETV